MRLGIGGCLIAGWMVLPTFAADSNLEIPFDKDSPLPLNVHRDDEKSISFPMQFHSQSVLPVLEDCYVNGMRLTVTLDTGSSLGLVLFPRTIERLGFGELARTGIPLEAAG